MLNELILSLELSSSSKIIFLLFIGLASTVESKSSSFIAFLGNFPPETNLLFFFSKIKKIIK
jgi:hypothetical protein